MHGLFGHPEKTWASDPSAQRSPNTNLDSVKDISTDPPRDSKKSRLQWPWKRRSNVPGRELADGQGAECFPSTAGSRSITQKGLFWPKELLPKDLPLSRIYTWGYDVDINHIFWSAGQATVFQHSRTLLSHLADVRISEEEVGIYSLI